MKLITRRDLIIVLSILLVGLIWLFAAERFGDGRPVTAVISVAGSEIMRIDLSEAEDGTFTADGVDGVTFEIKDGAIRIASSDCRDKICVSSGFISRPHRSAVCLPKKLCVTIEGESSDGEADLSVG